ncbi:MAG: tetratricopeptide repeat protein, partial [Verrucomicrobiota bacterium]
MAEIWLNEIREQNQAKYNAIKKLDEFDENNLAAFYPQIYQMKFGSVPQDGYQAIETYMSAEEVKPSIGYSILAQVLRHTRHNVVLTTNFDRLTETALLDFENTHARVIAHESMLNVVPVHDKKPSIIKVHRDMIFSPISTEAEIAELDKKWRPVIQTLFSRYHVIALGYGGNDGGLMSIIKEVLEANPQARLFWCYRKQLPEALPPLMSENEISGRIEPVSIAGFDEFLFKLRRRLNFGLFTDTFETSAKRRKEAYLEQLESVQKDDKSHKGSEHEKAVSDLFADTWWEVEVAVNKTDDIEEKDKLYQAGIKKFPDSRELIGNYALFLHRTRKDYDGAGLYYKKALDAEPNDADFNGNYALFLHEIRKDYDQAETFYKKALAIEPDDADFNGNYALFLHEIRKDYDQAEIYYKKALESEPDHANNNGNYALFLKNIRK